MREQVLHLPFEGRIITALLFYNDKDMVDHWELLMGKLNISKMTYAQVREMTGLSVEQVDRIRAAVQLHIDMQEGRV